MTVRDSLVAELRRVAGKGVHVIDYQDATDVLDRKTIVIKQRTIQPAAAAPMSQLRIDYTLTFVTPMTNAGPAEIELDSWVPALLDDLRMNWFVWTMATKVLFAETNIAYDVDAYVLTTRTNETKEG
jgi:hypothetical protein